MKRKLISALALLALPLTFALSGNARAAIPEELRAGNTHTCVRSSDGTVSCWGGNSEGQLGNGTLTNSSVPVQVPGLTGVIGLTVGYQHTCALKSDTSVVCWGRNDTGQLGDNSVTRRLSPVPVAGLTGVTALSAHTYTTCALMDNGGVKCWGHNNSGQLGDATLLQRRTPVNVLNVSGAVQVVTGLQHTCARLASGQVKCWGLNADGQLGTGNTTGYLTATPVVNLSDATALVAGQYHTCIRNSTGGMKCWGSFAYGQLGNGMTGTPASIRVSSPTDVTGLQSGVWSIYAPSGASTCAVMEDGTAKCWGFNGVGQLGVGDKVIHSTPANVLNLNGSIYKFTIGGSHACAYTSGDGLVCWGSNNVGQHGAGNNVSVDFPQKVVGL